MPVIDIDEKGVSLEFPEGMAEDEIKAAIYRQFPDLTPERAALPDEEPSIAKLFLEEASQPFLPIPSPQVEPDDTGFTRYIKGFGQTAKGLVEGLESPLGVSTLAAAALPGVGSAVSKAVTGIASKALPVAGKAVGASAGFGFGIPAFLTGLKDLYLAQQAGDPEAAGRATGEVLAGIVMQAGGLGVLKPRGVKEAAPEALAKPAKAALEPAFTEPPSLTTSQPLNITPQPPKAIQSAAEAIRVEIEGRSLIDESRIKTADKPQDVMPGRGFIASPEFEFRKNPEAFDIARKTNEAELDYKFQESIDRQAFEQMQSTLSKLEQTELSSALKKLDQGEATALDKLSAPAQAAAKEIRAFYDHIKGLVQAEKAESARSALTEAQQKALDALESGASFDDATSALRSNASKEAVRATADELAELKTWGIENYTTFMERGSYRVVVEGQGTVAIGRTRAEAALKADKWLKEHPDVKSVTLDDEFAPGTELPTRLSRGQYWRLVSRLEESTGKDAKAIQSLLHAQGSIVAVKPTAKFAGPLLPRRDILKGEENVFDILPVYSHIMRKKLALDPVLRDLRNAQNLPKETRAQLETLLGQVKGEKFLSDKIADYLLSPLGREPMATSRASNVIGKATTMLKLGYRATAALINRLGITHHVWTKAGSRWLAEGRALGKTAKGKALVEANKPFLGLQASFAEAGADTPLWHPMGMFQAAERAGRPEAFLSFYKMARDGMGMDEAAAVQYARDTTRFALFTYNIASLPRLMRGPIGRQIFKFKPYLVKELEFISTLRGMEWPRYLTGALLLGGPRAALITLRSLPFIGAFAAFDKLEDWLNQEVPRLARGIPGALGMDVSPATAFQFPEQVRDLAGPFLSDLSRLYTEVIKPVMQGESRDFSDVRDWAVKLAPMLNSWNELVESFVSDEGWTKDWKGRIDFKPSELDKIKMALGAKPLKKSIQEVERRFLVRSEEIERKNRTRLIEEFLEAQSLGDTNRVEELRPRLREAEIQPESIRRAHKQKKMEPRQRLRQQLSRPRRAEEAERFQEE